MKSMMSTVRRRGRSVVFHVAFGPTLARANKVRADRSFCWSLGNPRALRISVASWVFDMGILNLTEQRSFKQVGGYLSIDAQLLKNDKLNRVTIQRCKPSNFSSHGGNRREGREFHAANLGCIDLGIAADGSKIAAKQCGVK